MTIAIFCKNVLEMPTVINWTSTAITDTYLNELLFENMTKIG